MNNTKEKVFIAVAWPYANGPLHLGHISGTYLACDFFARYKRLTGADVLMVSGSDTHGTPITVQAQKENLTPKEVVDKYHPQLVEIFKKIGTSFNLYTHTRTKNHREVVQDEFIKLFKNGYLFEKEIEQLYCTDCQRFLPDRYVEGECPHCGYQDARGDQCDECGKLLDPTELVNSRCKTCGKTPELRKTTHLFIDLKKIEPELRKWIDTKQDNWRKQVQVFTSNWLKEGLQERAFTRDLKDGVPVPWERLPKDIQDKYKEKVIYVWFEAVTGYLSAAVEWAKIQKDKKLLAKQKGTDGQDVIVSEAGEYQNWEDFWKNPECKHYYFLGKDNIPFHSIIWPALIVGQNKGEKEANKLNLPYDIVASQFLTLEGQQFSKSRNWSISVNHIVDNYGIDAVRYYFAAGYPENKDIDFTWKQFVERVNNELVANLGNFIHRTLTFTYRNFEEKVPEGNLDAEVKGRIDQTFNNVTEQLEATKFAQAIGSILELSRFGNQYLNDNAPWKLIKENKEAAGEILFNCLQIINAIKVLLYPFLPHGSNRLNELLGFEGAIKDLKWEFTTIKAGKSLNKPVVLFNKIPEEKIEEERALLGKTNTSGSIVVGEVLTLEKHPTKEHLSVVKVNIGKELQIVCGAHNLEVGQKVPVATVGAIVPESNLEIKKTKFGGIESNGMLCSGKELNVNENADDIYILDKDSKVGEKF